MAVFFLIPFALLFGFLGRFNDTTVLHPGFDNNAVFLVVLAFIIFVFLRSKKYPVSQIELGLFVPELLAIAALFHVCSNIAQFNWAQSLYLALAAAAVSVFSSSINAASASGTDLFFSLMGWYHVFLYGFGIVVIVGAYAVFISKCRVLKITQARRAMVCFVAVALWTTMYFGVNRAVFLRQYDSIANAGLPVTDETFPPVILIVLDTLRKRSLDEHPDIFKNLTAFARESLVFDSCIANSSWTLPSHASMFTGLALREHGTHFMQESDPWFDGWPPARPLHDRFTTLAEVFESSGYLTAAVVSNFGGLNPCYNLHQGFHVYDWHKSIGFNFATLPFKPLMHVVTFLTNIKNKYALPYRKAEDINTAVDQLLRRLAPGPFFLFINYLDPHDPYMPTNRFKKCFLEGTDISHSPLNRAARFLHLFSEKHECSLDELLYKGEIAYLDHHFGKLLELLKAKDIYDDALIIVTSDHGELFCKKGYSFHKTPLYEGVTRVPLFIKFPRQQVTGIEHQYITLADLYPTILTICGLPYSERIPGKPYGKPAGPVVAEFYHYDTGEHRALYNGRYKYMKFERGKPNALYDLQDDPLSDNSLIDALPEKTAEMEAMLADWVKAHPPLYGGGGESHKEMNVAPAKLRDDLRSLGYIQ